MMRIAVIGGGLSGLAAAVTLVESGHAVELFEAKRRIGGRATSLEDPQSVETIDNCQHVAMGCCTNFLDFCRRTEIDRHLRCDSRLHFFAPDGIRSDFRAVNWLPAPLHLAPSFIRLSYLSLKERAQIGSALVKLARSVDETATIGTWLRQQGQSENAIRCFWEVILVSALAESLDRASLAVARKVLVDGFVRNNSAYRVYVPTVPLNILYDQIATQLAECQAVIHYAKTVRRIEQLASGVRIQLGDESLRSFDFVVVAVPWRRVADLLPAELSHVVNNAAAIPSSPITSLHLWFDKPIMDLPHAVLIDRLSQWVFAAPSKALSKKGSESHYYQVVISASRDLAGRERESVLEEVLEDLRATWSDAKRAKLLDWRMITEQQAVFSVTPEVEQLRPLQQTACSQIMLAGDWTRTGWPATMEGAVRSGYLAAEAILEQLGVSEAIIVPDLQPSWLARWLQLV
jgi:squalene-associated FAD-dependent desaturase